MDASKIIELQQKRANIYINRSQQSVDASVITWQKQIQSSRYLPQTSTASGTETPSATPCGPQPQSNPANLGGCKTCGGFSTTTTSTNSEIRRPNPFFSAKGSGAFINSCDAVTYKRAGDNYCSTPTTNQITSTDQLYIQLPRCFCNNVDRYPLPQDYGKPDPEYSAPPPPDTSHAWLNPYLPNPQPFIQKTQPPPCKSCNHYKIRDEQGKIVNRNVTAPFCSCEGTRRATDPLVLP